MTPFDLQTTSIQEASRVISLLPSDSVWSLCATEDDDIESPTVLNIFIKPTLRDRYIAHFLSVGIGLGKASDVGESFISYRRGGLLISFIEEEEKHES